MAKDRFHVATAPTLGLAIALMHAVVRWRYLVDDDDAWGSCRCLYAYQLPRGRELLYIGKSWGVTVSGRWLRPAKEAFWNDLERDRGVWWHRALVGHVDFHHAQRFTHEILSDIESLLIFEVQPWGNIQSRDSRISRPGLVVDCLGDWPEPRRRYRDGD